MGAVAIAAIREDFFFIEPNFSFRVKYVEDVIQLGAFCVLAMFVSWVGAQSRKAKIDADKASRALAENEGSFRELLTGLTNDTTPEAMLSTVAERTAKLVGADAVYIERLDAERQEIIATAAHGEGLPEVGTRGLFQGSVAAQVIETGQPVCISNVRDESRSILGRLAQSASAVVLPLRSAGEAIGALIVIRRMPPYSKKDIAQLEVFADLAAVSVRRLLLLERLEEALRCREEFVRVLAHDLRNPVNTISLAAASFRDDNPTPESLAKLREIIERSTSRMSQLIQDLLDEAVIERSGLLPINPQPHDCYALGEEVCQFTRVHASAKKVHLTCDIPDHATIHVDRARILQVLANLVDNALKFTPAGGRIVVREEPYGNHLRFSVFNNGSAIPEDHQKKIFDPYFQAPGNTRGGAGLGLTIAKRIVEQHGGAIWVESKEGEGTTFFFTIPAGRAAG
jgi:signal transduction histidine kinase